MRRYLVLLLLASCGAEEPPRPDEQAVAAALRAGDMDAALAKLEEAVKNNAKPLDPATVKGDFRGFIDVAEDLEEAVALLDGRAYKEATAKLLPFLAEERKDAFFFTGLAFLARGKASAGLGSLEKSERTWATRLGKSVAFDWRGDARRADAQLDLAVKAAPDNPIVGYYLARRALRNGDREKAKAYLEKLK